VVYIGWLPRNEGMALAKVSGAAERVHFGLDRHLPLEEKIAVLYAEFDVERVPAARRPILLGVLLAIVRTNGEDRHGGMADLYEAAGAPTRRPRQPQEPTSGICSAGDEAAHATESGRRIEAARPVCRLMIGW
jgi:hypothetical protein